MSWCDFCDGLRCDGLMDGLLWSCLPDGLQGDLLLRDALLLDPWREHLGLDPCWLRSSTSLSDGLIDRLLDHALKGAGIATLRHELRHEIARDDRRHGGSGRIQWKNQS